jgi:hypothetical protein
MCIPNDGWHDGEYIRHGFRRLAGGPLYKASENGVYGFVLRSPSGWPWWTYCLILRDWERQPGVCFQTEREAWLALLKEPGFWPASSC